MPVRTTVALGSPCWIDLMTCDPDGARTFYGGLFGWTADEPNEEFGGYFMFNHEGQPTAGCMSNAHDPNGAEVWSIHLATDDVEKTLETAKAEGGTVVVPAMTVGETGVMGYVLDPSGAGVGVWQAKDFAGFATYAEPGAPSWWELLTTDYAAAVPFYRDVFRWETEVMSDTADFRYTVQKVGEEQAAGIMDAAGFLTDGVPSQWSVYFGVEDTDAALATVVELGGSIVLPAEDTPYGRLATVTDPTGAQFKLIDGIRAARAEARVRQPHRVGCQYDSRPGVGVRRVVAIPATSPPPVTPRGYA